MRLLWQGFTDPVANRLYVDRLFAYIDAISGADVECAFVGIDPPDRYLYRMTELRCCVY